MPSLPTNFGLLEPRYSDYARSAVAVLPVPFERTTSYGKGTAAGPAAILRASQSMELWDEELQTEAYRQGISTLPPFLPDAFGWRVAETAVGEDTRALALYLPGVDIAADALDDSPAVPDLVRRQLIDLDRRIEWLRRRFASVAVVVDPGRRPPTAEGPGGGQVEGAVVWLRRSGCKPSGSLPNPPPAFEMSLSSVAAGLIRDLGLPQSAELAEPPAGCSWPEPPARLPTLGVRGASASPQGGDEYLRSLRALGYL